MNLSCVCENIVFFNWHLPNPNSDNPFVYMHTPKLQHKWEPTAFQQIFYGKKNLPYLFTYLWFCDSDRNRVNGVTCLCSQNMSYEKLRLFDCHRIFWFDHNIIGLYIYRYSARRILKVCGNRPAVSERLSQSTNGMVIGVRPVCFSDRDSALWKVGSTTSVNPKLNWKRTYLTW